jgi:hypothetical protein
MTSKMFDPTTGERARAIGERRADLREPTDPTAGERARMIHAHDVEPPITDPTDPRSRRPRRHRPAAPRKP